MKNKNCRPFQLEIEEAAAANRSIGTAARMHLTGCPVCAGAFGEHTRLRELIAGLEPVAAPPDFDFRLRARLAATRVGASPTFSWRWQPWRTPVLGLATALVLVIGGAAVFNQNLLQIGSQSSLIRAAASGSSDSWSFDGIAFTPGEQNPVAVLINKRSGPSDETRNASRDIHSGTVSVTPTNRVVMPPEFDGANPDGADFSVPMRPASSQARIMVDEGGRMRNVVLPAVSFGSEDLMVPVVSRTSGNQRIW